MDGTACDCDKAKGLREALAEMTRSRDEWRTKYRRIWQVLQQIHEPEKPKESLEVEG